MTEGTIINLTHGKQPTLWIYERGTIHYRPIKWKNWIFVTGDPFDMDFLERQLCDAENICYETRVERDVYGPVEGMRIYVDQREEREFIKVIKGIGYGRKFRIYNGLLDPGLKIMASNNLSFFHTISPLDYDPQIPVLSCNVEYNNRTWQRAIINNRTFLHEREAMEYFIDTLRYSPIIIYHDTDHMATFLYRMELLLDRVIPYSRGSGKSFLSYGRVSYSDPPMHIRGKVCINGNSFMYREGGLNGIFEISRITGLAPETVCRVTPGTAVSSLENYEALRSSILIITDKDDHEEPKPMNVFMENDRGGYVFQPEPGFYRNVYEIDFSSMYPSIMHHFNMSPETIGVGKQYKLPGDNPYSADPLKGFIPSSLDILLKRRLICKYNRGIRKDFESRDRVLKWLLLTSFGYTGFKNARFGKIEMHEAITSVGRWALERAMRISESEGFSIIHGIVDSLFIQGNGNIQNLLHRIRSETSINIVLDGHYRWMVFLPARSGLGALNRYFGLKYDGSYKVRGIGIRRSDSPHIVIRAQEDVLKILGKLRPEENSESIYSEYLSVKNHYINHMGDFPTDQFSIGIRPSKYYSDYMVNNIQKAAISSAMEDGVEIMPGQSVAVIVNDSAKRVVNMEGGSIDRNFYRKILMRNFEPFDFLFSRLKKEKTPDLSWWF
ncbi:MAG: type B DNA-directed DNA polymerase [Cuniculiplasma sp.]